MLQKIDNDIWLADGACVNFFGFPYPTRSVIVRLHDEALWVWSPIRLTDALQEDIQRLGTPKYLVSPNKLHHLFLGDWAEAYPSATLWGLKSTIKKRSDLKFEPALTDAAPEDWRGQLDQVWFHGSIAMDEIVFFHRASRTVIMADLSENFSEAFLAAHWRPWQRRFARLWGIVEGKGYAPLEWRLTFLNHTATKRARDQVLSWDAEKVVMAHGAWQPSGGQAFLKKSLSWIGD